MYHGRGYAIPQNRDEVKSAIALKHKNLIEQVEYYQKALDKIDGICKGELYVIHCFGTRVLAKCMDIGMDRVLVRIMAAESVNWGGFKFNGDFSFSFWWGDSWTFEGTKVEDLPLYVGWSFKTKWYLKALKKG